MSRFLILWLASLLPALLLGGQAAPLSDEGLLRMAREALGAESCELVKKDSCRAAAVTEQGKIEQLCVLSDDYCCIRGYNGITRLGIVFDGDGTVQSVWIIDSEDTPSFVRRIKRSSFPNQFNGYHGERSLNTVTGATITSQAILQTVGRVRERVVEVFLQ